ncbi:MAG: hypothetical protein KDA91_15250 [Planctomycetaceae bacterium]|nr:hypothetical protein [Planctomycetaceae bacterium]
MALQDNETLLNNVLISMAHSFLQYVSESWPWVSNAGQSLEEQVNVIAARQRQDVADIVALLNEREFPIDFGTFPTEYTDLQFLSLLGLLNLLDNSQQKVCNGISDAVTSLSAAGDEEGAALLRAIEVRQRESVSALKELHQELSKLASA